MAAPAEGKWICGLAMVLITSGFTVTLADVSSDRESEEAQDGYSDTGQEAMTNLDAGQIQIPRLSSPASAQFYNPIPRPIIANTNLNPIRFGHFPIAYPKWFQRLSNGFPASPNIGQFQNHAFNPAGGVKPTVGIPFISGPHLGLQSHIGQRSGAPATVNAFSNINSPQESMQSNFHPLQTLGQYPTLFPAGRMNIGPIGGEVAPVTIKPLVNTMHHTFVQSMPTSAGIHSTNNAVRAGTFPNMAVVEPLPNGLMQRNTQVQPMQIMRPALKTQAPSTSIYQGHAGNSYPNTIQTIAKPAITSANKITAISSIRPASSSHFPLHPFDSIQPNGKFSLEPYIENYCDNRQYSDEILASMNLQRVEYFIANLKCSRYFFQCAKGQTFLVNCTGQDQVFDINTINCNFKYNVRTCAEYDHVLHCTIKEDCQQDQFACCAPPQQCIHLSKRCDGVVDCADADDENNCPACDAAEFPCVKSAKCIPWEKRCNGVPDECLDQTNMDEFNCGACPLEKFACSKSSDSSTLCIDPRLRCNGAGECPRGEDELNCKAKGHKYLLCENQKHSVTKNQWCDGYEDCLDGSDEKYCIYSMI